MRYFRKKSKRNPGSEAKHMEDYPDLSGGWRIEDAWIGDTYCIYYYKAGYKFTTNNLVCAVGRGETVVESVEASPISNLVCNEGYYTCVVDNEMRSAIITGYSGKDDGIIFAIRS